MKDLFGDDDKDHGQSEDFAQLLEQSLSGKRHTHGRGDKVKGEVISIGKEEIFVIVGDQDGSVSKTDLIKKDQPLDIKIGQILDLYVIKTTETMLILSAKVSGKAMGETLEDAFDLETPVSGTVAEIINGGYRVEIEGKRAFCPFSQMDLRSVAEPEALIGRKFDFIITKFEKDARNLVVSRRKVLELEKLESEGEFLNEVQPGTEMNGTVTRLEPFGAFVEIKPGIEGLVHISELAWSRLAHPSEDVTVGQELRVRVLKIEEDARGRLKISLSKKQAEGDPWLTLGNKFYTGGKFPGVIRQKERFGLLIELAPGIVGLLPQGQIRDAVTETGLDKKKPGDTLMVTVEKIDVAARRISLTVPQSADDTAWKEFDSTSSAPAMGTLGDQFKTLFKK
jgi:small subunit ribosomal protein S1